MAADVIVTLDIPAPCAWISANGRYHYHHAATLTAAWRAAGQAAAAHTPPLTGWPVRVLVYVHKPTAHKYDAANLAPTAKAVVDGFTTAGLWPDDDNDHVLGPDIRRGPARRGNPGLTVTLTEKWAD